MGIVQFYLTDLDSWEEFDSWWDDLSIGERHYIMEKFIFGSEGDSLRDVVQRRQPLNGKVVASLGDTVQVHLSLEEMFAEFRVPYFKKWCEDSYPNDEPIGGDYD